MVDCRICGKEFKNTQGLAGHMSFKHGIRSASTGVAPAARLATEQDLKQINYRTEQLEASTNVATEQLEKHTQGLADMQSRLSDVAQQVRLLSSDDGQFDKLLAMINRIEAKLNQTSHKLELLERYVRYEVAGVADDHMRDISLIFATPKRS